MKRKFIWILVIITGVSGLLVLVGFVYILSNNFQINGTILPQETGITGDFIGGVVGTLWSLTGIFLFYLALTYQRDDLKNQKEAIKLQTDELRLQREELVLQRKEMEENRKVVKEQSETMKVQKFETTFFNLVRNHNVVVEAFIYNSNRHTDFRGSNGIDVLLNDIESDINELRKVIREKEIYSLKYLNGEIDSISQYISPIEGFCEDLILIIEFIEKNDIVNYPFYCKLLFNTISNSEKLLFGFYLKYFSDIRFKEEIEDQFLLEYDLYGWEDVLNSETLPPRINPNARKTITSNFDDFQDLIKKYEIGFKNVDKNIISVESFSIQKNNDDDFEKITTALNWEIEPKSECVFCPFDLMGLDLSNPIYQEEIYYRIKLKIKLKDSDNYYYYVSIMKLRMPNPKTVSIE